MTFCINPSCQDCHIPLSDEVRQCKSCGSNLILQNRYRVTNLVRVNRGFGNVYEVADGDTPKILKVLQKLHSKNVRAVQLFRQEADILSHFDCPGIPKCEGYFQYKAKDEEKLHCLVMEKIDGYNLEDWVHQNQPISEKQTLEWLTKITTILKVIHDTGYLHRDIKPHNIMLKDNGEFVFIDFGAATRRNLLYKAYSRTIYSINVLLRRQTESDGFIAPEQNRSYCTPQSDIFALGKSFVFLLTGRFPGDPKMYDATTGKLLWCKYAEGISDKFTNIIDKAIEYDPRKRYKNTQEILNDLARVAKA